MECLAKKGIAHWASLVHPKLGSCWVVNILAQKNRAQPAPDLRPSYYILAWPDVGLAQSNPSVRVTTSN